MADRVASEWGDAAVGKTVGYNMRLESKFSAETTLLFCTTGTLLRMLMSNRTLAGITHVVLDEVHERDRFSDFLLILLRQIIVEGRNPGLRVVLEHARVATSLKRRRMSSSRGA